MGANQIRPRIPDTVKIAVWAAAAGRCAICNEYVVGNDRMGEAVAIGELAHNVGWSVNSPRGETDADIERSDAENLLLVCRNCHKPTDTKTGRYTVGWLRQRKMEHELRIKLATEIGADRSAVVLRMVGEIRGTPPELTYDTALDALVAEGYAPQTLSYVHRSAVEIDLRGRVNVGTSEYFKQCAEQIDGVLQAVLHGVQYDEVTRVAVFGFARIPLLVHLGARLDDKVRALIFQRHRVDNGNPWRWPDGHDANISTFSTSLLQEGSDKSKVALLVNVSGTIKQDELPPQIDGSFSIYTLSPELPLARGPSVINSLATLKNFEETIRVFLAQIESEHGKIPTMAVFPAVPISGAIALGRALMLDVSPALQVYDRDNAGKFFEALEVKR